MCHISELCRYLLNSATRVTEVLLYHGGVARGVALEEVELTHAVLMTLRLLLRDEKFQVGIINYK